MPLGGGVSVTLCKIPDLSPAFGASWGSDGRIVFGRQTGGLWQISTDGGMPEPLTSLDSTQGEVSHRLPHVLPGGDAVVFTVTRNRFPRWSETQLVVYSRRTGERTILIEGGADARYVATGHLVYVREGVLMAAPFDLTRLEVTGGSVGVIPDLMQAAYHPGSTNDSGAAQFTVSETGAPYIPGGVFPEPQNSLVLVDRTGGVEPLPIPPGPFAQPRLSPGGERFAVGTLGRNQDIWVADMARSTFTRLTTEGRNASPVWTPDGTRIVYRSAIRGADGLFWRPAGGSGAAELLVTVSERNLVPASWSPDGQVLAFYALAGSGDVDIWVLPMNGDRRPRPVFETPFFEGGADFSPDGQWLAYDSDESGRRQMYVRAYPGLGARQMISTAGACRPSGGATAGRSSTSYRPHPAATMRSA